MLGAKSDWNWPCGYGDFVEIVYNVYRQKDSKSEEADLYFHWYKYNADLIVFIIDYWCLSSVQR